MIPLGVLASARTAPPTGPPPLIQDTFTRANGALGGTKTDTGQTWQANNTTSMRIVNNKVVGAAGYGYAMFDTGVADYAIEADIAGPYPPPLVFRAQQFRDTQLLRLRIHPGVPYVRMDIWPSGTSITPIDLPVALPDGKIRVEAAGRNVTLWHNGAQVFTYTVTQLGTSHSFIGLFTPSESQFNNGTVDNLKVWAL